MKKNILLILTMFVLNIATAQVKTVTGLVIDENGLPLAGANVKNGTIGISTDAKGNFTIKAKVGDNIKINYLGMEPYYITIGTSDFYNVRMRSTSKNLESVVVTAMGIRKQQSSNQKRNISKVKRTNEQLFKNPSKTFDKVLIDEAKKINESFGDDVTFYLNGKKVKPNVIRKEGLNEIREIEISKNTKTNHFILIQNNDFDSDTQKEINKLEDKFDNKNINLDKIDLEDFKQNYSSFEENNFESVSENSLSTISIDVDNASYTIVQNKIDRGNNIFPDDVRIEEMVNYFNYSYNNPKDNEIIGVNYEMSYCPWNKENKLLKVSLKGKEIPTNDLSNSNFVFLIDVSGSMNQENKLPLVKKSLEILTNQLRAQDYISIVVYAGAAGLVLPPTSGSEKTKILKAINDLKAGGSTAGGEGIKLAYKVAKEHFIKDGNNRIILTTDGDFNVGISSNYELEKLISEERKSGVYLTCLGYGIGNYKDSKLETLADKGNGNYAYINTKSEAIRFLEKEFKGSMYAIAKDVKIQLDFNKNYIDSYRLIGYENRKLNPKDFDNDTIDAGELGSGQTVTVLYEVITKSTNDNENIAILKIRCKPINKNKSLLQETLLINNFANLENTSDDFKFSSAVAWFGQNLKKSIYTKGTSLEEIKNLASQSTNNVKDRMDFIELIDDL